MARKKCANTQISIDINGQMTAIYIPYTKLSYTQNINLAVILFQIISENVECGKWSTLNLIVLKWMRLL